MEIFIYHATPKSNVPKILKEGLKVNQNSTSDGHYYTGDMLFFTFLSADEAYDIVECCMEDENIMDEISVFQIPLSAFDIDKIGYDFNDNCESYSHIRFFTYEGEISPENLKLMSEADMVKSEMTTIEDLLKISDQSICLAEKLIDIWDENYGDHDRYLYDT